MPYVLKTKWEKQTGIPNRVLYDTYMKNYRRRTGALAPEKLCKNDAELRLFKRLLGSQYGHVDEATMSHQLEYLRKNKKWNLSLHGPDAPRAGYKERAAHACYQIVGEYRVEAGGRTLYILTEEDRAGLYQQVLTALKGVHGNRTTPTVVR